MTFIWYPKCSTCKRAKAYLDDRGVTYEARDIKIEHPTADELQQWHANSGLPLKRLFNTSGLQYRALELKDKLPSMTEQAQYDLLATDGMLIRRPVLVQDDGVVLVGFKQKEWDEVFA